MSYYALTNDVKGLDKGTVMYQDGAFAELRATRSKVLSDLSVEVSKRSALSPKTALAMLEYSLGNYAGSGYRQINNFLEQLSENRIERGSIVSFFSLPVQVLLMMAIQQRAGAKQPVVVFRGVTASRAQTGDLKSAVQSLKLDAAAFDSARAKNQFAKLLQPGVPVNQGVYRVRSYLQPKKRVLDDEGEYVYVDVTDEKEKLAAQEKLRPAALALFKSPAAFSTAIDFYATDAALLEASPPPSTLLANQLLTADVGQRLTFAPFSSASFNQNIARGFALKGQDRRSVADFKPGTILEIALPAGMPCVSMTYGYEQEVLLPPCTTLVVTRISREVGTGVQVVRAVAQLPTTKAFTVEEITMLAQLQYEFASKPRYQLDDKGKDFILLLLNRARCAVKSFEISGATPISSATATFSMDAARQSAYLNNFYREQKYGTYKNESIAQEALANIRKLAAFGSPLAGGRHIHSIHSHVGPNRIGAPSFKRQGF